MKKVITYLGYSMVIVAMVCTGVLSFIRVSGPNDQYAQDLLGLSIPTPPTWTIFIPIFGDFIEFIYSLFSWHGLVIIGIWGICITVATLLLLLGDEKDNYK